MFDSHPCFHFAACWSKNNEKEEVRQTKRSDYGLPVQQEVNSYLPGHTRGRKTLLSPSY